MQGFYPDKNNGIYACLLTFNEKIPEQRSYSVVYQIYLKVISISLNQR